VPGDFREFFDPRKLTDRQRGEIEYVLNSPAYEDSFKPYMEGILRSMDSMWRDRSQKRKDTYPDDFLAGGATFGEGLIKFFDLLLRETSMERIHLAMERITMEDIYDKHRADGHVRPVVGLDQSALPQPADPAEDF
jgi:hypothetical protein